MIRLDELHFGYGAEGDIIDDVSVTFGEGTMSALVGRSGSGKSTLLYLIGLMLTPTAGGIEIDGVNAASLADWARAELRARLMGFVFQDALLDPARSVLENILEGALYSESHPKASRQTALQLLDDFGVEVDPRRRPGQISGGQAQRVALCRAFIGSPRIVLADEPTGNLDEETADIVWNALAERAAGGATVIIATHDRDRAQRCDTIVEVGHVAAR